MQNNKKNSKPCKSKIFMKKKPCVLCQQGVIFVDYKDTELLNRYLAYNGKILPRRITGCCAKHQKMIANAIKRARIVALLPFVKE
nr:30S ribosomal protein S18 [uncultured Mycoplasmataceae bacterium]